MNLPIGSLGLEAELHTRPFHPLSETALPAAAVYPDAPSNQDDLLPFLEPPPDSTNTTDELLLRPRIMNGFVQSVRTAPDPLLNALMPAIRNSVQQTVRNMMESTNNLLERGFSLRIWRWRIRSWLTGKPLSEIILFNSTIFVVERAFLIHRESGLLIDHVAFDGDEEEPGDAEQVSALLTALRSFITDSFKVNEQNSGGQFRVGGFTIWTASTPHCVLALAIRGAPTFQLRQTMAQTIRGIQRSHAGWLASYNGNTTGKPDFGPQLASCLHRELKPTEKQPAFLRNATLLVAAIALVLIGLSLYRGHDRNTTNTRLNTLRQAPGYLVTAIHPTSDGFRVEGSRDPLSATPAAFLRANDLEDQSITFQLSGHLSLHPDIVLRRVRQVLRPPPGVKLRLDPEHTLVVRGVTGIPWSEKLEKIGPLIPGIAAIDAKQILHLHETARHAPFRTHPD